jgi:filamentous hemagglutinin family protein
MARRASVVWRDLLLATTCLVAAQPMSHAATLPSGLAVTAGQGSVSTPNAQTAIIHQTTDKAVFEWQNFSIGQGAGVVFQQPGSGSIALNRVRGPGASQIDGSLQANGQVWIVNPNGVIFGQGARVDVGGLMATTADIRNQDFLSGDYSFSGATGAAIVNQGEIRAATGGSVVLAGAQVRNEGLIQADLGTVQLAAGKSFAVDLNGDKLIRFQVTAAVDQIPLDADGKPVDALISNTGRLSAAGGRVLLTARAARNIVDNVINTSGIVEATTASLVNGEIVLDGGDAGMVKVAGSLDASGKGAGETGGMVSVLGDKVALGADASIDVSGDVGGGTALIGGAAHGAGPQQNATTTLVAGGATIDADALTRGAGGTVVVWSEDDTSIAGSILARGGALIGDGGFVETSSKGVLGVTSTATIAVDAPAGAGGEWLLDPRNVTIGGHHGTIAASSIERSLNHGGNVTITTGHFGHQAGNITVNSAIAKTRGGDASLTLNAANDIRVNAPITSTHGKLAVDLVAGGGVTVGAQVATNGGSFTSNARRSFVQTSGGRIDAGAGTLQIDTERIALGGASGSIHGTGAAFLAPHSDSTSIGLGSAQGTFSLSQSELNTLAGFSSLTIGKPDGGWFYNHGSQEVSLGGHLSFALPTTIAAGRYGDIDLESTARISVTNSSLTFATGRGGSFIQHNGATLAAANGEIAIDADSISLQGPAGSLGGRSMTLAGALPSTSIGVGTGAGTLRITQATLDSLANFASLDIGGDTGSGLVTIDGAVTARTTTGFGGKGTGASLVLGSDAAITTTAPDGSGLAFFSGTGGSVTQNAGATVDAGNSTLMIGADRIVLNGPAGSIQGARGVVLTGGGHDEANAITVGGAGSLVTQGIIDKLADFSHLTIGALLPSISGVTPPVGTSLITVNGPIAAKVATTFAATAPGGKTILGDGTALSSAGKAIDFAGAVTLGGNGSSATLATIDTTNGGAATGGASITFGGTLDGTSSRLQALTLTAGSAGDVTFAGRVGVNDIGSGNFGDPNGVRLGDVTIKSANNVNLAMAPGTGGDGFSANSFTVGTTVGDSLVAGAARLSASSYINVNGSGSGPLTSNGGAIIIDTTGDIVIAGNLRANGRFNSTTGAGNGGTVKLVSGGTVTVNTTDTPAQTGFDVSTFSISANGVDANSAGSPGNGGAISVTAANIDLPLGVFARGGDALIAGPNGGNGGSIVLAATGNLAVGGANSGTVAGASARGGASVTGRGGAGGAIAMTGENLQLTTVNARGGDTQASSGGGNAGNILLTATATSGDAVTLYGVADAAVSSTLSARGGRTGVTFTDTGTSGGTLGGAGGNITIQGGAGGLPLAGTSEVRLATNTGTALGGGSIVGVTSAGGSSGGGIAIAGPIATTTDNVESLRLAAQSGSIAIGGAVGTASKRVNTLTLVGNPVATIASVGGVGTLDLGDMTGGSLTFPGAVAIDAVTTAANPYSIAFNGGGTIGDPVFSNTGTLTFLGLMNVPGGLLSDGPSATNLSGILASADNPIAIQHLVVGGNSAIATGTAPVILGSVDQGANSLVIASGGANLFLGPWTGSGVRLVEPATVGASVGLAGAAGDFTIDANSLQILASGGPSLVKIGRDDYSGALTANAFTFDAPLMLFGSGITLADALTKNTGALTLQAGGAFGDSGGSGGAVSGMLNLAAGTGPLRVAAASANFTGSTVNGASGADAALIGNVALTQLGAGPFLINGVSFPAAPVVTSPLPNPIFVPPPPPPPPPLPIYSLPPPPPAPVPEGSPAAALVQTLGGQAEAAAALANIAPAAGPGSGTTDTESSSTTDGDKLTKTVSQPLQNGPPSQPTAKKPSATSTIISGMLSKFQPPTSSSLPPAGTTPGTHNFSSWGNEAFW